MRYLAVTTILSKIRTEPIFEAMYIYEVKGEIEEVVRLLGLIRTLIYSEDQIAKYYRHWGWYYIETKDYERAYLCHRLSLSYEPGNSLSYDEITYIIRESKTDFNFKYPTVQSVNQGIEKYKLSFKIDPNWFVASEIVSKIKKNAFGD